MNTATLGAPVPKTSTLKIDSRGRVRFASQGMRFELTKNGLNVYDRSINMETTAWFNINRMNLTTLRLLTEAYTLVNG